MQPSIYDYARERFRRLTGYFPDSVPDSELRLWLCSKSETMINETKEAVDQIARDLEADILRA